MSLNDPLANMMSQILNAERVGKKECMIKPQSLLIKQVLSILKDHLYVGDVHEVEDGRGNYLVVNLLGRINKCGVIRPRLPIQLIEMEKFEKRYLPAKNFGVIIMSTSQGLLIMEEAKKRNIGGRLLAYCY